MAEIKPCGSCGITGIHACLGPPLTGVRLMCGVLTPEHINSIKRELDLIDKKAKEKDDV